MPFTPLDWTELVGLAAGAMTTSAFMPQALKTWRSKNVRDLSLPTYALFTTGVFCWLAYGLLIGSLPVILTNAVTFILAAAILAMKLRYTVKER